MANNILSCDTRDYSKPAPPNFMVSPWWRLRMIRRLKLFAATGKMDWFTKQIEKQGHGHAN